MSQCSKIIIIRYNKEYNNKGNQDGVPKRNECVVKFRVGSVPEQIGCADTMYESLRCPTCIAGPGKIQKTKKVHTVKK